MSDNNNYTPETMQVKIAALHSSNRHSNDIVMIILEAFHSRIQVLEKHILNDKQDVVLDFEQFQKQQLSNNEFFTRSLNKYEDQIDCLQSRINDAENSITSLEEKDIDITDLGERMDDFENNISDLNERCDDIFDTLDNRISDFDSKCEDFDVRIDDARSDVLLLHTVIDEVKKSIDEVKKEVAKIESYKIYAQFKEHMRTIVDSM